MVTENMVWDFTIDPEIAWEDEETLSHLSSLVIKLKQSGYARGYTCHTHIL